MARAGLTPAAESGAISASLAEEAAAAGSGLDREGFERKITRLAGRAAAGDEGAKTELWQLLGARPVMGRIHLREKGFVEGFFSPGRYAVAGPREEGTPLNVIIEGNVYHGGVHYNAPDADPAGVIPRSTRR
jgi:hypothetical protein